MKKILFTLTIAVSTAFQVIAQGGAAINTTGAAASTSAILDVSSTTQGILVPRMSELQKNSISSPETGLLIYQTDGITGFWYYNGVSWVQAIGPMGATGAIGATGGQGVQGPTGATGPLVSGTSGQTLRNDGNNWIASSNLFNTGTNVGLGTTNPNISAKMDITSNNSGFLIPRMTTAERNAISNPAEGLQIINLTTKCLEVYFSPVWQSFYCGCGLPSAPSAGSHVPGQNVILWNWNTVSSALGYKYNTSANYSSAIDNGTNTSFNQTGLTCETSYTLYVWAYNICGSSTMTTLTQTTSPCLSNACGIVTFTYNGSQVTYGTVNGDYNSGQYCWLDRNLGANAVATSYNHPDAYGDLFQWGRLDDGHQLRSNINFTTTLSSNPTPGHSSYITGNYNWYTGTNPSPDNLWQGVSGINNPCPSGWRLPTATEYDNERVSWTGGNNYYGAFQSPLKLTVAGMRGFDYGALSVVGADGHYWSSTVSNVYSVSDFHFHGSHASLEPYNRAHGMSIRCIHD